MKRKDAIAFMRIAGYHGDSKTFTRLLIENKVSFDVAGAAFTLGKRQRLGGMKCNCLDCNRGAT